MCFRENEKAILRRTEKAMVRAMCGAKLISVFNKGWRPAKLAGYFTATRHIL